MLSHVCMTGEDLQIEQNYAMMSKDELSRYRQNRAGKARKILLRGLRKRVSHKGSTLGSRFPKEYEDRVTDTGLHSPYFGGVLYFPTLRLPLLGEIACGKPILAEGGEESMVEIKTDVAADFCLRAKGDSMTGSRIYDGDLVLIREQDMVENGEIAAVLIKDEATLKRVYYYPEKARLVLYPDNPAYMPLVFSGPELSEVRILGKAVALQTLLP